jgi:hypothetical protein
METKGAEDSPIESRDSMDQERQDALARLSQHAVALGLYDRNEMPEGGSDE